MSFTVKYLGKEATFEKKTSLLSLIKEDDPDERFICARVNNRLFPLTYEVYYDAEVQFLTCADYEAVKIYESSLRYIVAMAFQRCYPDLKVVFSYNVSRSICVHLRGDKYTADTAMLLKVQHEIDRIIKADFPLERKIVTTEEARKVYVENGYDDKLNILPYRPEKTVHLVYCDGYVNYMYSPMVPSTGYLKKWKMRLYAPGFIIQYPRSECKGEIPEWKDDPTYGRTLRAAYRWAKVVGCDTIAGTNAYVKNNGTIELLNLCEAMHNRMLCELGQIIEDGIDDIKLICVAGPSSSGKTTFANRLRIELMSRGIKPIRISLDDYYVDRDKTPCDENGERDLESIEALDIERFNNDMVNLIAGEEVQMPRYDFKIGKSVLGRKLKLEPKQPLIIEGIHALNDRMTLSILKSQKFKIFISPHAQINLDDHNPLSLTDLRLIRRIVRDKRDRNSSAEETIGMWPSVRRGEFKWIYGTQEGSDYVYNSFLPYELLVLKKYVQSDLMAIPKESTAFPVAERVLRELKFFVDMEDDWVPSNSLMREFIGGSCYADV